MTMCATKAATHLRHSPITVNITIVIDFCKREACCSCHRAPQLNTPANAYAIYRKVYDLY